MCVMWYFYYSNDFCMIGIILLLHIFMCYIIVFSPLRLPRDEVIV